MGIPAITIGSAEDSGSGKQPRRRYRQSGQTRESRTVLHATDFDPSGSCSRFRLACPKVRQSRYAIRSFLESLVARIPSAIMALMSDPSDAASFSTADNWMPDHQRGVVCDLPG